MASEGRIGEALCVSAFPCQCASAFDPTNGMRNDSCVDALRRTIRELMNGRTEKDVGDASGVGQTWLNRVMNPEREDGIRNPGIPKLRLLAKEFGVPVERFLGVAAHSGASDDKSQPMRLDPVILAESIAALRQVAKRRGWSYDPELHAESTCYAYELWQALPSRPSTADVIDLGERIADRLRTEVEGKRGGNQSGSSTGAGADDRGQPGQAGGRKAGAKSGSR